MRESEGKGGFDGCFTSRDIISMFIYRHQLNHGTDDDQLEKRRRGGEANRIYDLNETFIFTLSPLLVTPSHLMDKREE